MTPRPITPRRLRRTATAFLALAGAVLVSAAGAAPALALQKGFWGPTELNGVSQFPVYEKLGVTLFQTSMSWAAVAPTRPADPTDPADPAYQWPASMDGIIREAASHRMTVLIALLSSPPWANGGRSAEYAPTNPADFAAFARAAARRYPAVRRWLIWGEPTRSAQFKPLIEQPLGALSLTPEQAKTPRRYARILDAAYGQLKAERKSNLVIGGNSYTTGEIRPIEWVHHMKLPDGRPPRMDLYGHNPFSFRSPSLRNPPSDQHLVDFSDLGRFDRQIQRDLQRKGLRRIRLFLSEFTIPTAPDNEFNYFVEPKVAASWITKAFRIARKLKADGLGWIHLRDDPTVPNGTTISSGLLTYEGGRKPGFYAFMRGGLTAEQRARARRR